jgi:glutamate 5-kinase
MHAMSELEGRNRLRKARLVVVKVGSKAIAVDATYFSRIASEVASARAAGHSVVLVTSGAIALGVPRLGYRKRPTAIADLQACAAAGQSQLMASYEAAFAAHKIAVAQVLLTHADLSERQRATNAQRSLQALLARGAVPILNENDSVAIEEIKFGDNDQLAALVTALVSADALFLLSDVDGLRKADGSRVTCIEDIERDARPHIRESKSDVGTGGMTSKVAAAERATFAGADVIIASARESKLLTDALQGKRIGTLFLRKVALSARLHWVAFSLRAKGRLVVDDGCAKALLGGKASLLSVGLIGVQGDFEKGDCVEVARTTGEVIGRGLVAESTRGCARFAFRSTAPSSGMSDVVIHRDDLAILKQANRSARR